MSYFISPLRGCIWVTFALPRWSIQSQRVFAELGLREANLSRIGRSELGSRTASHFWRFRNGFMVLRRDVGKTAPLVIQAWGRFTGGFDRIEKAEPPLARRILPIRIYCSNLCHSCEFCRNGYQLCYEVNDPCSMDVKKYGATEDSLEYALPKRRDMPA